MDCFSLLFLIVDLRLNGEGLRLPLSFQGLLSRIQYIASATMGGLAFNKGTDALRTPRMPRCVYLHVKKECTRILQTLYDTVESPIDGPDKDDYGDVDLLVQGPKTATLGFRESMDKIGTALGAFKSMTWQATLPCRGPLSSPTKYPETKKMTVERIHTSRWT